MNTKNKLFEIIKAILFASVVLPPFFDVYSVLDQPGIQPDDVSDYVIDQGYSTAGNVLVILGMLGLGVGWLLKKRNKKFPNLMSASISILIAGMSLVHMDRLVIQVAYLQRVIELILGGF